MSNNHIQTPDWVKDAVFYQVFPDRFATSERVEKPSNLEAWDAPPTVMGFKGGDLLGVAEHLDHLERLGINAIYFNPIFQSAANHRYHTHDYFQVDPLLGGNDAFRELLDQAHARNIRVILDGVFNHASRGFFQFNHILECGPQSPYLDWFTVNAFPVNAYSDEEPNYRAWIGLPALPEFNTANPQVREYIFRIAEYWVNFGIDGWRLDVPFEIDDDAFWQEFRRRVKNANPEAYLVGELWGDSQRWLSGDQFDAQMNYLHQRACIAFFGARTLADLYPGGGFDPLQPIDAAGFTEQVERMLSLYDWEVTSVQMNLLDSHDTARFLTMVGDDKSALKLAMLFTMTMPGAPTIYYGDEVGLSGGYEPESRGGMPWDESCWDHDLLDYIRAAIQLRHDHPTLRRGQYQTVLAEGETAAYLRTLGQARTLVAFNAGDTAQSLVVTLDRPASQTQVLFGQPEQLERQNNTLQLRMPKRSGVVIALDQ